MDNMDALTDRVLKERLRVANLKLEKAVEQRDRYVKRYVARHEIRETLEELEDELTNFASLEDHCVP